MARAAARAAAQPELRLGNRTAEALQILRHAKMLSEVFRACATLETSTRLSPACCAAFAAGGAAGVLLKLSTTMNRSAPHLELLKSMLTTLTHVAKAGFGAEMVSVACAAGLQGVNEAAAVLAETLASGKEGACFVLAADLLVSLSHGPTFRAACAGDVGKRVHATALSAIAAAERKAKGKDKSSTTLDAALRLKVRIKHFENA